jgi:hypothetical protein
LQIVKSGDLEVPWLGQHIFDEKFLKKILPFEAFFRLRDQIVPKMQIRRGWWKSGTACYPSSLPRSNCRT